MFRGKPVIDRSNENFFVDRILGKDIEQAEELSPFHKLKLSNSYIQQPDDANLWYLNLDYFIEQNRQVDVYKVCNNGLHCNDVGIIKFVANTQLLSQ